MDTGALAESAAGKGPTFLDGMKVVKLRNLAAAIWEVAARVTPKQRSTERTARAADYPIR